MSRTNEEHCPQARLCGSVTTSWPGQARPSRSDKRRAPHHRDHRDKPGDDVEEAATNDRMSAAPHTIGITGPRPVMTRRVSSRTARSDDPGSFSGQGALSLPTALGCCRERPLSVASREHPTCDGEGSRVGVPALRFERLALTPPSPTLPHKGGEGCAVPHAPASQAAGSVQGIGITSPQPVMTRGRLSAHCRFSRNTPWSPRRFQTHQGRLTRMGLPPALSATAFSICAPTSRHSSTKSRMVQKWMLGVSYQE